jgi:serine/threonine protein phosphatase PrpC
MTSIETNGLAIEQEPVTPESKTAKSVEQQLAFTEKVEVEPAVAGGAKFVVESATRSKEREEGGPNEDALFRDHERGLYGVLDGAGGIGGAALASKTAAEALEAFAKSRKAEPQTLEGVRAYLKEALAQMHRAVLDRRGPGVKEGKGMITTASLAKIFKEGPNIYAVIANVGDSPIYVRRATGEVEMVSKSQDMLGELLVDIKKRDAEAAQRLAGLINTILAKPESQIDTKEIIPDLPKPFTGKTEYGIFEQAVAYNRMITSGLGAEEMRIDTRIIPLQPGDELIIASDGVGDNLSLADIATEKDLIGKAVERSSEDWAGAKKDDMTVLRIRLEGEATVITPEQQEAQRLQEIRDGIARRAEEVDQGIGTLLDANELEPRDKAAAIEEMMKRILTDYAEYPGLFTANETIQRLEDIRVRLVEQQKEIDRSKKFSIEPVATTSTPTSEKQPTPEKAEAPAKKSIFARIGGALKGAASGIRALAQRRAAESEQATTASRRAPRFSLSSRSRFTEPPPVESVPSAPSVKEKPPVAESVAEPVVSQQPIAPAVTEEQRIESPAATPAEITPVESQPLSANEIAAIEFNQELLGMLQSDETDFYSDEKFAEYMTEKLLSVERFGDRTNKEEIALMMNRIMYQALRDDDIPVERREALAKLLQKRGYVSIELTDKTGDYRVQRLKKNPAA